MSEQRQRIPVGPGTEREYVSLGRRLLAALLDNAVWLFAYVFFLGSFVSVAYEEDPEVAALILFVYLSLWFNYFAVCEWRWGQTIGKNATGIMVASVEGERLSFGQASIRNLLRLIDWLVIGWVMIAAGARKQRLGDKLAGTVVVRRPSRTGATMVRAPELAARQIAGAAPTGPVPERAPAAGDGPAAQDGPAAGDAPAAPGPPAAAEVAEPDAAADEPGAETSPGEKRPGFRGRLPAITWTLKDTIWGLIAGLILAVLSPILVLPFDPGLDSDAALLAAQGVFALCLLAVPLGVASGWSPSRLRLAPGRLGLRSFAASALGWTLLAMFLYYVFAGVFSTLVFEPQQDDIAGDLGVGDDSLLVAIAAVLLIAVVAPISEELFFRGFVFSGLRSRLSAWPAVILSGLIFGSIHAPTGITTVIPLAVLGGVLAWLYEKTGSLWPSVMAHAINNGLALAILSSGSGLLQL